MIEIRDFVKEDIKRVMEIENQTFIAPWKEEEFLMDYVDNAYSNIAVLVYQDYIIGFYDYWHTFDSASLAQIAVDPKYQGQHFGSLLLEEVIKECTAKKVSNITLEVRKNNEKAVKLYQKYGFKVILTKPNYYSNGDDAYYMVKELN